MKLEFKYTFFLILILVKKITFTFFWKRKRCLFHYRKFFPNQIISFESTNISWKSCFNDSFDIAFSWLDMLLLAIFAQDFDLFAKSIIKNRAVSGTWETWLLMLNNHFLNWKHSYMLLLTTLLVKHNLKKPWQYAKSSNLQSFQGFLVTILCL